MIYHVYANQSNVGDWLSAKGIQSCLPPGPVTELFCDEPFVPHTIRTLQSAAENDFVIIGGGGLFMDYFIPFWRGFEPIAERVPFAIWGTGYCDMKREDSLPPAGLISGIVSQSRLCVVRDEMTRAYLSDAQLPAPVICPTVLAVENRSAHRSHLLHVDHFNNAGENVYDKMVSITEEYADRTGRACRQINNLIAAGHAGQLRKVLDLYADAELVVSSRLHGCIIALAMGRRVLGVSGDRKMESFMDAAGLGEWVCDLDEIDSLPWKLEALHEQEIPFEFIERGRFDNRKVGRKVRDLIEGNVEQSAAV